MMISHINPASHSRTRMQTLLDYPNSYCPYSKPRGSFRYESRDKVDVDSAGSELDLIGKLVDVPITMNDTSVERVLVRGERH